MKFAHDFDASVRKEQYPQSWLRSAIQYRQLKKCIRRVQQELQHLGLDQQILDQLWKSIDSDGREAPANDTAEDSPRESHRSRISIGCSTFKPTLTVAIHPQDGTPVDAWLSPDTLNFLRRLSRSQPGGKWICASSSQDRDDDERRCFSTLEDNRCPREETCDSVDVLETVEIPLRSDSEFFQSLQQELRDLGQLQRAEKQRLTTEIGKLGAYLTALTQSSSRRSKAEISAWRELFSRYIEAHIFFSAVESGAEPRSSAVAQKHLEEFDNAMMHMGKERRLITSRGRDAVNSFLEINSSLLQFLKFQELNRIALTKILKKFDKRTALHAQATSGLPQMLTKEQFITQDLAKAACFTIQDRLLPIIPQLNDYLCPICFSISYKPVRLKCHHVFCIRCLLVMQQAQQDHCPLCRGGVVMEASPEHLDTQLMDFLRAKFPSEVKAKQKENERAVGVDLYGKGYDKCAIL